MYMATQMVLYVRDVSHTVPVYEGYILRHTMFAWAAVIYRVYHDAHTDQGYSFTSPAERDCSGFRRETRRLQRGLRHIAHDCSNEQAEDR